MQDDEEIINESDIEEIINDDGDENIISDDEYEVEDTENDVETQGQESAVEVIDDSYNGFFEHTASVYSISMFENLVVSGGGDDVSHLWNTKGEKLCKLGSHSDSVSITEFSADGRFICSAGLDGLLFIFDTTGELITQIQGPPDINWVDWHPRGPVILAGSEDGTVWMWQIPTGQCMHVLSGHSDSVTCGRFTPDGKAIVTGSLDSSIIVWDPKSGQCIQRFDASDSRFHQYGITSLDVSKDNLIVSGGTDGSVCQTHLNGKFINSLTGHEGSVETIKFNSMNWVCTGGCDGKVLVWDLGQNNLRCSLEHSDAVTKVHWVNFEVISSCMDGVLRVWDSRTGEMLKSYQGHQAGIMDFAVNADGNLIATASDDATCLLFSRQ